MPIEMQKIKTTPKVSERNERSVGKWMRIHAYFILTNLVAFCPCPKNLSEV